ncbi:MAG: DUF302 domain-containing protein [Paracoccaceae bacterium]
MTVLRIVPLVPLVALWFAVAPASSVGTVAALAQTAADRSALETLLLDTQELAPAGAARSEIADRIALLEEFAAGDLVRLESPHSVATTIDRLAALAERAGATVFARIDHAAGGAEIDQPIPPNQVLIFGNPAIGTPVMAEAPEAGLDLPLRVQAYELGGVVTVAYHAPAALARAHGVPRDHPAVLRIADALGKLTAAAVAP